MNIVEMKEKRNRLVVEASSLVKGDMNAETRAKVDAIYADADAIKGDIERAERSEALEAEMRKSTPPPPTSLGDSAQAESAAKEVRAAKYKEAFSTYLRKGERGVNAEQASILSEYRTQSAATLGSGGYTVPIDLADQIEVALKYFGGMRAVSKNIKTSGGGTLNWPTNNDVTNVGAILSGSAAEQDLTFSNVPFGAFTYTTKQIPVQKELLQDSAFNLEEFIREAFVNRIGRIQNTHFTVGTGTTMPNGVGVVCPTGVTAATGGATSITYGNLVDTLHSVDVAYRSGAKWMFNDLTLAALRKLVDTQNRPLLGLGINGGDPDTILGYQYVINNDVPVMAASAKSVLFGDFSKYLIRDVAESLQIVRLDELGALSNQVIFVGFTRADGQLLDAGTHPIQAFANSAT